MKPCVSKDQKPKPGPYKEIGTRRKKVGMFEYHGFITQKK